MERRVGVEMSAVWVEIGIGPDTRFNRRQVGVGRCATRVVEFVVLEPNVSNEGPRWNKQYGRTKSSILKVNPSIPPANAPDSSGKLVAS